MIKFNTILHPSDFSDVATGAFAVAADMAAQYGAELHVLHVIPQPSSAITVELGMPEDYRAELEAASKRRLGQMVESTGAASKVTYASTVGDVAGEIVSYAKDHGVDLIVMGTNGYTGVKHLVLGSVAEKVLRRSGLPVLAIPA